MGRDAIKIAKLVDEYRATYKAWQVKHEIAFGTNRKEGNEDEAIDSMLAYQAMEKARQALMDADK